MGYELDVVHLEFAIWLSRNNYKFIHHYQFPSKRIADFIAWSSFHETVLIVECKSHIILYREATKQVLDYRNMYQEQFPEAKLCPTVVFPYEPGTEKPFEAYCDRHGLWGIQLYRRGLEWPANISKAIERL